MKITAVIVVYNKEIDESITCKHIENTKAADICIVDNSTEENHNYIYCMQNEIDYISMGGNKGLSKAYNTAINYLNKKTDVIVLLDDDTDVPVEYFEMLRSELIKHPDIDIFAPIIQGQDGIVYSPNNFNFFKNHLVSLPMKEVKQESFNAISSCLAIRMRVFENYRYNEKLFVDEVDHCFFREQRKLGRKFGILNVQINQNFHQRGNVLFAESAWLRLRIRIIDIFRHARLIGGIKYILLAFIKCCGLGIQMAKKSKSLGVMMKAAFLSLRLVFDQI